MRRNRGRSIAGPRHGTWAAASVIVGPSGDGGPVRCDFPARLADWWIVFVVIGGTMALSTYLIIRHQSNLARLESKHDDAQAFWETTADRIVVFRSRFGELVGSNPPPLNPKRPHASLDEMIEDCLRRAEYHARLREKYHAAARHPWLPVAPDPPVPE